MREFELQETNSGGLSAGNNIVAGTPRSEIARSVKATEPFVNLNLDDLGDILGDDEPYARYCASSASVSIGTGGGYTSTTVTSQFTEYQTCNSYTEFGSYPSYCFE